MSRLAEDTSAEIEYGLVTASQQHLESQIEGTAERINLWMGHAQADLRILADITQKLIDHREEFRPMTEAVTEIPFFADKMQYYPEGGYSQNASDEPTVVTIQTIYHDENSQIKSYPQQIIDETALLDLIMPAIHTQGAEKMWTYFAGDTDAGFLRLTPWTDFGREAIENYPEQMNVPYWAWFPGLVEAWEKWLENPDSAKERTTDIVTFPPAIDAASGQTIQIFGHPLWNRERTQFAGAVWYDLNLAEVTDTIEGMELTKTGFAFLALGDGNVIAIPERGPQVMGLQERIVGDGHLLRSLEDSREREVAALVLPQDDAVSFLELQLAGEEYTLVMRRLAPMNVFLDGAEQISVQYWTLGFVVPKDEIFAPLIAAQTNVSESFESILMIQAIVLVVVVMLLIGFTFFFTGRMTRGLASLSAGASQLAQGNFDTRVEILSTDEIGRLGSAFNKMARQLEESFAGIERRNIQLEKEALERQQAEKELWESQERLRHMVENMPVMMQAFDAEGNILVWNKECERVAGYSAEEIVNNPRAMELLYPDSTYREQMMTQWAERGNDYYGWEWELTARDGTVKTVAWSSISDRLPIPGWAAWGTGVDVTERVQAEEVLKEYSERLEEMVEERTAELQQSEEKARAQYKGIPVPTYTWQKVEDDILLVDYNDAAEEITQGKIADFVGIRLADMYRDTPEMREEITRCFAERDTIEREMRYRFQSTGQERHLAVKYAFVPPDLVLIHTEDVTERVRTEEEIRKHTTELKHMVNLMAGREVRMAELKQVIRRLRAQLEEVGLEPVADDPLLGESS